MDINLKVGLGGYGIIGIRDANTPRHLISNVLEYVMTLCNLTQSRLKEVLNYNPVTGIFTWIKNTSTRSNVSIGEEAGITHKTQQGKKYRIICINGVRYKAHRLVWLYVHGIFPNRIDHENGNGLDNKYKNIRNVSTLENARNKRLASNNTVGVVGVYFSKEKNKWVSLIGVNKKSLYLGAFSIFNDAVIARKMAEYKYGFHSNHGVERAL